jgi:hypothetical protein
LKLPTVLPAGGPDLEVERGHFPVLGARLGQFALPCRPGEQAVFRVGIGKPPPILDAGDLVLRIAEKRAELRIGELDLLVVARDLEAEGQPVQHVDDFFLPAGKRDRTLGRGVHQREEPEFLMLDDDFRHLHHQQALEAQDLGANEEGLAGHADRGIGPDLAQQLVCFGADEVGERLAVEFFGRHPEHHLGCAIARACDEVAAFDDEEGRADGIDPEIEFISCLALRKTLRGGFVRIRFRTLL